MTRTLALVALAATACSPAPTNDTTPANVAAAAAPQATPPPPVPKPGALKTFRDWTVGCDNGLTCKMASLGPEDAEFPAVTMSVTRVAGPRGDWKVEFASDEDDAITIAVDDMRVAAGDDEFTGPTAAAIIAAMANGNALQVSKAGGAPLATLSLAGASAALRYIDAMQGRAGGVTAAVAKGATPAGAVPAAPALPTISAFAPYGAKLAPSAAQVAEMRRVSGCDTEGFTAEQAAETHALGGGKTLVIVPCSSGAYNLSAALFTLADGKIAPVITDAPSGFGAADTPGDGAQIVNGGFDDGLVTSYVKGRGLGDCGVSQKFAWDGTQLRLVEQEEMGECRGNTEMIRTWTAPVVRK